MRRGEHGAEAREALRGSEMETPHHVMNYTKDAEGPQPLSALVRRTEAVAANTLTMAKAEWGANLISLGEEVRG